MEQLLLIGIYTVVVLLIGAMLTFFLMISSRKYDIRVLQNLYTTLETTREHLERMYALNKSGITIPRQVESTNFGSRSDEAEAALEE